MPSKVPGPSGTYSIAPRVSTTVGFGTFTTAAHSGGPTLADLKQRAQQVRHALSRAIGWNETNGMAVALLGHQSFTLGVVAGMGTDLVRCVVGAVDMVKMFALAEYWESREAPTFVESLRSRFVLGALPGIGPAILGGMDLASHFFPGFDREAEAACKQREALVEGISYAFKNPKEVLLKLTKSQEARFKQFAAYEAQHSLSGNFYAGLLFGELLFDLLMLLDLATGLVALARMVPKMAEYAADFAKLANEFRQAVKLRNAVKESELAPAGPRLTSAEKAGAGPGAGRTGGKPQDARPEAKPEPPEKEKPAPDFDGQDYLANERKMRGLPGKGEEGFDDHTVAVVRMNGESYPGVNRGSQDPITTMTLERVNAQTLTHAEADAVQNAVNDGAAGTQSTAEMWIDREPCRSCGVNGGLRSMARNLKVDQLIVNTPTQQLIILPTK